MTFQRLFGNRSIRFVIWALLTFAIFLIAVSRAPHMAIYVPCICLPLFVPMVLLPVRRHQM